MKKLIVSLFALLLTVPALAEDAAQAASTVSDIPLLTRGLIVTAGGLGGVFLVLILFFLLIKAMHKMLK